MIGLCEQSEPCRWYQFSTPVASQYLTAPTYVPQFIYPYQRNSILNLSVHPGRVARHVISWYASCVKWVKVILLSSCVRAEDILCECAIRIRLSALRVIINSTNTRL